MQLRRGRAVRDNTSTSHVPLAMADTASTSSLRANETPGHLSVHLEGNRAADVPFLFEQQQKRIGPAVAASFAYHGVMIALLILRDPLCAADHDGGAAARRGQQEHHLAERTWPRRRRWWWRQPDEGAAASGRDAGQGQNYGSCLEAAETRKSETGGERARPGRAVEHPREEPRGRRRIAAGHH